MNNFRIILAVLITTLPLSLQAQQYSITEANIGYLITATDSISGSITVNMENNTLLLVKNGNIDYYSAGEIKKALYLTESGEMKMLTSGYWGESSQAIFFEVLVEGKVPLLFREDLKFSRFDSETYEPFYTFSNGHIYAIGNKRSVAKFFSDNRSVSNFIKKHKLKTEDFGDMIYLFSFLNKRESRNTSVLAADDL